MRRERLVGAMASVAVGSLAIVIGATGACGGQGTMSSEGNNALVAQTVDGGVNVQPLTDAQVVGAIQAVDAAEVQEAQLALQKTSNPNVKAYATMVVADHQYFDISLSFLNITGQSSALSQQVQATVAANMATLQGLSGSAFDQQYVQNRINVHTAVVQAINQLLPPSATVCLADGGITVDAGVGDAGARDGGAGQNTAPVVQEALVYLSMEKNHLFFAEQLGPTLASGADGGTDGGTTAGADGGTTTGTDGGTTAGMDAGTGTTTVPGY
jgi:predicted outer membrane protein